MSQQGGVEIAVTNWAAWAPGLADRDAWRDWAAGKRTIEGFAEPDVQFVAPLMRRRLSKLTRMAFRVATDCLDGAPATQICIFCSRYGEFDRTFEILKDLAKNEPISASKFSMSVHNTAASLFSIHRGDTAPSLSLASGEATLETAIVEAYSLLATGEATTVVVVQCDEPLPQLYDGQATTARHPLALALALQLPGAEVEASRLSLAWSVKGDGRIDPRIVHDPALHVLRLMLAGGDPVTVETERLTWQWRRCRAAN